MTAVTGRAGWAPPRLLVIEDDDAVREGVAAALRHVGYEVRAMADGVLIDATCAEFRPDLLIIDVMLPVGPNGFDLAARVRSTVGAPVVILTAADALDDRLRGFEVGADDYLVKPFAMSELLARCRAVLRRSGRLVSPVVEIRDLVIDDRSKAVTRGGRPIDVTPTEFELLRVLASAPGRVFSKVELLSQVWGFDQYDPNLVEVHVSSLRRKLEAEGSRVVHTRRNAGYVFQ